MTEIDWDALKAAEAKTKERMAWYEGFAAALRPPAHPRNPQNLGPTDGQRMIKATPGWSAWYTEPGTPPKRRPIEAWSETGDALTVSPAGHLIPAAIIDGFSHLSRDDEDSFYLTAVPGQGWYIRRTNDEGQTWNDPVIAFVINRCGDADIMTGTGDGHITTEHIGDADVLTPPSGWPPAPDEN